MVVKIRIAWIGKTKDVAIASLTREYLKRISRYTPVETAELASEEALLKSLEKPGRTRPLLALMDSRGKQWTSEEIAEFVREQQDRGTQELVFAIGPADGWSDQAVSAAQVKISLGKITLAHELARVVLLEQIYRAWTIIKGHPYHTGH